MGNHVQHYYEQLDLMRIYGPLGCCDKHLFQRMNDTSLPGKCLSEGVGDG